MANDLSLTDGDERCKYVYPVSTTRSFLELISDLERDPRNVDVSALYGKTKNVIERVVEPKRSGEPLDEYIVRVFADVFEQSGNDDCPVPNCAHDSLEMMKYAKYAADSGDVETARIWYLRMIAHTDCMDPTCWALYGTFCTRVGDLNVASACARKAVTLDGRNRFALFVHVAVLMTADKTGLSDEMQTALGCLNSVLPLFGETHVLFALHYRRIDMPDHAACSLAKALLSVNGNDRVPAELAKVCGEPAINHGGDPIVKCVVMLIGLDLAQLAVACLRCFSAQLELAAYHYLMALSFHVLREYKASSDHLISMSHERRWTGRRTLLSAHNDFETGRTREAIAGYFKLCLRRTRVRYILAYSRTADYLMALGKFTEATDLYHRACTVTRTPELMTKLAACLIVLQQYSEAEKVLADVIAENGAENGLPWHHMAVIYSRTGRSDAAELCRRQASVLGFKSDMHELKFDVLSFHSAESEYISLDLRPMTLH